MMAFDRESGIDLFGPAAQASGRRAAGDAQVEVLRSHLSRLGLLPTPLEIGYEPATGIVRLSGSVAQQDQRERIVLCCGNVRGVSGVHDLTVVVMPSDISLWRFVQPGDTFESIAQDAYRDAERGDDLRMANQPLVGHAGAPEPGWLLRIPAADRPSCR